MTERAHATSRAPQGARGLKSHHTDKNNALHCRAPQGARGLKFSYLTIRYTMHCRAPQGARGLKSFARDEEEGFVTVVPRKGHVD